MKVAILETSYACNQSCVFCYNSWLAPSSEPHGSRVLTAPEFCRVVDKLREWGVDNLGFSGGEPLLNPGIFKIAEHARSLGLRNSLLTNGRLAEAHAEQIAETMEIVQFAVHGSERTHNALTGGDGFGSMLRGLVAVTEYDTPTGFAVTVSKRNRGELGEVFRLAGGLDVKSVLVNRFLPGGRGLDKARDLSLNGDEVVEMLEVIEAASDEYGVPAFVGTPTPLCLDGVRDYKFILKEGCVAGRGVHCAVSPSGGLRICNHSPRVLGDCLSGDPRSIYEESDYVKGFTELRYAPDMCDCCDKLVRCRGGCREAAGLLHGDIRAADPVFSAT